MLKIVKKEWFLFLLLVMATLSFWILAIRTPILIVPGLFGIVVVVYVYRLLARKG